MAPKVARTRASPEAGGEEAAEVREVEGTRKARRPRGQRRAWERRGQRIQEPG